MTPKSTKSYQNGAKRVPKGSQMATKMHPKIDAQKRERPSLSLGTVLGPFNIKSTINNQCKNRYRKQNPKSTTNP
jgi:hypothetical protein